MRNRESHRSSASPYDRLSSALARAGQVEVVLRIEGAITSYAVVVRKNHVRITRRTNVGGVVAERCAKNALAKSSLGVALSNPMVSADILARRRSPN